MYGIMGMAGRCDDGQRTGPKVRQHSEEVFYAVLVGGDDGQRTGPKVRRHVVDELPDIPGP